MSFGRKMARQTQLIKEKVSGQNQDVIPISAVESLLTAQRASTMSISLAAALTVLRGQYNFSTEQIQEFSDKWMIEIKNLISKEMGEGPK